MQYLWVGSAVPLRSNQNLVGVGEVFFIPKCLACIYLGFSRRGANLKSLYTKHLQAQKKDGLGLDI